MSHFREYCYCSRFTRGNAFLPVISGKSTDTSGDNADSYRASEEELAARGAPAALCAQLGKDFTGPVGPGRRERLCYTVHKPTTPTMSSHAPASLLGGGEAAAGGDKKHACKAGDREDHAQGAGISIHGVSRTQKGRRPEAGHKPEVLEQLCAYTAFQDGGHPCLAKSRRLDGCILYAPNS